MGLARGRIRTFINLFLRQAPLPLGLRVHFDFGSGIWDRNIRIRNPKSQIELVRAAGFEPANTCSQRKPMWPSVERPGENSRFWILDFGLEEAASVTQQIQNLKSKMRLASGKGFEPLSAGSEPAVLPVRRPRNIGRDGGARTRYDRLEKPIARLFAFIPVEKLVKTAGLEPTTFSFVARCSNSVELRPQVKKLAVGGRRKSVEQTCLLPPAICLLTKKIRLFSFQTSKVKGAATCWISQ